MIYLHYLWSVLKHKWFVLRAGLYVGGIPFWRLITHDLSKFSRAALAYYGSKWRLAPHILERIPPHMLYCEPFGGSAAVLLQKPPSPIEVYNDLDGAVVNFFAQLRENADELIRRIELTPHSRKELILAYQPTDDPLESARRYYVRSWQSRGANARWRSGWRYDVSGRRGKAFTKNWTETSHLWDIVSRLRVVQLECDDAFDVIARFDGANSVFYVDPPYLQETRSMSHRVEYTHEMDKEGHRELAALLHKIKGGVIISSYPSELYSELYAGWDSVEIITRTRTTKQATEPLWLSPRLQETRTPLMQWVDAEE